ncbi:hypothetical protein CARUB_v10018517mg [Capsella rubella]|uniref:LOB domain-containing protein n=1 Tax=Capsella rubella TaxID=81985 RepID=R0H7D0_9BRAS|nr:hypothetical protein CARUB_v10018517mg [Capsella rubella]
MESCECKNVKHACIEECVFAPYLPANKPEKYNTLSKVFDISSVAELVMGIEPSQKQACVDSLCFEAEARLRDPVMGCTGLIHQLQHQLQNLQIQSKIAKRELMMVLQEIHNRNRIAQRQNLQQLYIRSRF